MTRARLCALHAVFGFLCASAYGCSINTPTYFPGAPLDVNGAPATGTVDLTFRAPTAKEAAVLADEQQRLGLTMPVPWLQRADLALEVAYTLHNLDPKPGVAQIAVDGANEFTNYDVAAIISFLNMSIPNAQDRPVVLPLIQAVPVMVGAHETVQGLVREDDFAEAELDLDALGRFGANAAAVLINRSEVNPAGLEMMPKAEVVPAMWRVAVTVSADTHMTCDFVVRVRDGVGQLWDGSGAQFAPTPADYQPMLPTGN